MDKTKRINNGLFAWILLDVAICFMLCVFAPIDAYFANKSEYWFSFGQMMKVVIPLYFVVQGVLILISVFVCKTRASNLLYTIGISFFVYFYIQGNFVPRDYGILNGEAIDWNEYFLYGIISIVLLSLALLGIVLLQCFLKNKVFSIGVYVTGYVLCILIITMSVVFVQNAEDISKHDSSIVVTDRDMLSLSSNKNLIIFILDSFDSSTMQNLLNGENSKWVKETLKGFEYYPNTSGAYPTTIGGVPFILTGKWNENKIPYNEYIKEGYKESKVYDVLNKNNYSVGIYTRSYFINNEYVDFVNVDDGTYEIKDSKCFLAGLYKLCAFNYSPHQLKRFFYITADDFYRYAETKSDANMYSEEVMDFYQTLTQKGIEVTDDGNAYRIYHVTGTHPPYTFDRYLDNDVNDYGIKDEAEGCITVLEAYFEQLKQAGIWDSSSIIITADHGQFDMQQNPLFLVKEAGDDREFRVSKCRLSIESLNSIQTEMIENGFLSEEFKAGLDKDLRRFLYYSVDEATFGGQYSLPGITEYIVGDDASDYRSMVTSGIMYQADEFDYKYTLGTNLSFEESDTMRYCLYGFLKDGLTVEESALRVVVDNNPQSNLEVTVDLGVCSDSRVAKVYVNNNLVAEFLTENDESVSFVVPSEYVKNGTIDIKIEQPISGSYGAQIKNICINTTDNKFDKASISAIRSYKLGEKVLFHGNHMNASHYIVEGFSQNGIEGTWTIGSKAGLEFKIEESSDFLSACVEYGGWREQKVDIYINEHFITSFISAYGKGTFSFFIPKEYVQDGIIGLQFRFDDVKSPYVMGVGSDSRELGINISSICISETPAYKYGTDIIFYGQESNSLAYERIGFSNVEEYLTWTDGNYVEMEIPLENHEQDISIEFSYLTFNGLSQRVSISVNNEKVTEYYTDNNNSIQNHDVVIGKELISENILKIGLELPDAKSPQELGISAERRVLGLGMRSVKVTQIDG